MALSNRLALVLAGLAASSLGLGTVGCSSSNSNDTGNSPDNGAGGTGTSTQSECKSNNLALFFNPMYSAYIPNSVHKFQIPVIVQGVSGATVHWSASDPSKVQIDPGDQSGGALLTMTGSGDVTITANVNGACGSAPLHITEATDDQWSLGDMRYNSPYGLPSVPTDGGIPDISMVMNLNPDPPGMPPACTNCHGETAKSSFFRTVSHTPEQTGGFSDQELIQIFTQAQVPSLGYFDSTLIPKFAWSFFHKWSDINTPDAQQGMVVYLRSLVPKAQGGSVDFGNFMPPPRTGSGGATGAGGTTASGAGGKTSSGAGGTTSTGGTTSSTGGEGGASSGGAASGGAAGADSGGAAGAAGADTGGGGSSSGGSSGSSGAGGS